MAVCLCSLTCSSVLCRLRTHAHALYALLYYVICCAGVCCTLLCYACCTVEPRSCHAPLIPSSLFIRPCPPTSIPPSQYPRPFSLLSRPYPPDSISYFLSPRLFYVFPIPPHLCSFPPSLFTRPHLCCCFFVRVPPHPHIARAVAMDDTDRTKMKILYELGVGDLEDHALGVTSMRLSEVLR